MPVQKVTPFLLHSAGLYLSLLFLVTSFLQQSVKCVDSGFYNIRSCITPRQSWRSPL